MCGAVRTVGFVTTSFPRWEGDPAGSFVFGLARALCRRGHRIEVVAPAPPGRADWGQGAPWLEGVRVFGAPYAWPRCLQRLFYGAGVLDNIAQNPVVAGLVPGAVGSLAWTTGSRMGFWNAVLSHWLVPSALIAGLVRKRNSTVRHLGLAHSADVHLLKKLPMGHWLATAVVRSTDHLGFVSNGLREEFLATLDPVESEKARARSSVTPMGIDCKSLVSTISRQAARRKLKVAGYAVLFVGRLVPIKGVGVLLEAAANKDELQVIIAGDGPSRGALERQARERGVNARFLGWIGPEQRTELFQAVDVVVVPSRVLADGRHEGLPLVLIEALAAGRPVIASDTGAAAELIEHGRTGLLVPPENAQALRGAMDLIRRNSRL
ncbi:MAG: glycosyltransferase family 4 protein, partial [Proteobacteria bacterium]|nr:glycosyltransferase family 4 protein [Pseudomonadota bacterium]